MTLSPKEVVTAIWEHIFNAHDLSAADELIAAGYIQNTAGVPDGRAGFKATFGRYLEMSPDLRVEMTGIVEIGNLVVVRGKVFMANPPPGHASPIEVVDIFRVENGQAQEHWEV